MKRYLLLGLAPLLFACNPKDGEKGAPPADSARTEKAPVSVVPPRDTLLKQIAALEGELYASQLLDEQKAKQIVSLYEKYYQNYHRYPETPDFLFKAGEVTENINQPYRAIGFYTHCYEEYPAFKFHGECLFRMANLYDYKLNDYIKARALYDEVKVQFPKSQLAKDADAAIGLMGKSDQDVIRAFEKKNGVK
jgi:TolA-binding protein